MLLLMILLHILVHIKFTDSNSGSAVFYNKRSNSDCWSDQDILKLRARKAFEPLVPHINPREIDAKHIQQVLRYFRTALYSVDKNADPSIYKIIQDAIADSIGAHLRSEILPAVRFAYYAGYVPYRNARQIHNLLDDIKAYLNTQGLGWSKPKRASQKWSNMTVAKIMIGAGSLFDPCARLITKRDSNSCIHLPVPKHDDAREPSAVALPFKSGGLVSLLSPDSSNVLLKYYTTAARCIMSKSPEKCRHTDFVAFNNELWHWMKRDVAPHLTDEKLYSAYGGILRIAAAVQNYGKGLSRRNLFYFEEAPSYRNPWKALTESYVFINTDWTPTVYVVVVLLTAFSIYLVQICYSYVCGNAGARRCKNGGSDGEGRTEEIKYEDVETDMVNEAERSQSYNPPSPTKKEVFYSFGPRKQRRAASAGSFRTQQVYDLNEDQEKTMELIMSDESLVAELSTSLDESEGEESMCAERTPSPPRLQASVSQLTINRASHGSQRPVFSTSTMTRTLTGSRHCRGETDSAWSGLDSSSSSQSDSSTSCKSRRSQSSRDLAWARRVVSRHSLRNATTTSRTELDGTSFTTQTSQR